MEICMVRPITLQFIAFLRTEKKFGSIDELIEQIQSDADASEALLYWLLSTCKLSSHLLLALGIVIYSNTLRSDR